MKIGIDIDGVTADFVTPFLRVLRQALGRPVRYEEITTYRFQEAFGYSDEVEAQLQAEIDRLDMVRHLPEVPGALAAIHRLGGEHEVHFVTARSDATWGQATREWLDSRGFPYVSVQFREDRKAEASEGFDLFVEDHLDTALDLVTQRIHVCLFDRPWNRVTELPPGCTRVGSWPEVEEVVASF